MNRAAWWILAGVVALALMGGGAVTAAKKLPRGLRNNNPGNIEKTPADKWASRWQGEIAGTDPRFATFATMADGIRALGRLLLNYQKKYGINTVAGIINRWAPPSENDTAAYIAQVAKAAGVAPNDRIDVAAKLPALVRAIAEHENGRAAVALAITDADMTAGINRAVGNIA